jgi:membrane associated rhomboid family serine protease
MTRVLLVLNVVFFVVELWLTADPTFFDRWGLVPAEIVQAWRGESGDSVVLITLITSLFLHTGWLHLLTNLVYLGVFGSAVENVVGARRFLGLYLMTGLLGGLAHVVLSPESVRPAVGASGAVAGVMAAYLMLFPGATLGSLVPVLFVNRAVNTPAIVLFVVWLVAQLFAGVAAVTQETDVAWWAHVGGFVSGLVLVLIIARPRRRRW